MTMLLTGAHVMRIINKIICSTFLLIFIIGCSDYTNRISNTTKDVLQEKLNTDSNLSKYKMSVINVKLVAESMNKYNGIAKVEFQGTQYDVPLSVTADLSNILVQTPPTAFLFLAEKEINDFLQKIEPFDAMKLRNEIMTELNNSDSDIDDAEKILLKKGWVRVENNSNDWTFYLMEKDGVKIRVAGYPHHGRSIFADIELDD